MSGLNNFISNLVRLANDLDHLSPIQVSRLLDHSVDRIRHLRRVAGIVPIEGKDALIYLRTVSAGAARVPTEEWHHALLHAAEMIRDLHVVVDTNTEIRIVQLPDASSG